MKSGTKKIWHVPKLNLAYNYSRRLLIRINAWWILSRMGTGPKSVIIISLSKNRIRSSHECSDCRISGRRRHFVFQGLWSTKGNKSICQLTSNASLAPRSRFGFSKLQEYYYLPCHRHHRFYKTTYILTSPNLRCKLQSSNPQRKLLASLHPGLAEAIIKNFKA